MSNKDSQQDLVQPACNYLSNGIPWWNSGGPHIVLYPTTTNLYANMNSLASNQIKQVRNQILDQDSSSTQSTGHSHEVSGKSENNLNEPSVTVLSGLIHNKTDDNGFGYTHEKLEPGHLKQALSAGSTQFFFTPPKLDCNQSFTYVPYAYSDIQYSGVAPPYGSHAVIHPQMMAIPPSRVALPLQPAGEEPIYVNAKQYHAILRRREHRAKLESQNKIVKTPRKPYLHESRHLHAMKRARGTGGRFLNITKLQKQQSQLSSAAAQHFSGPETLQPGRAIGLSGRHILLQHHDIGVSNSSATPTCSEITSVSNSGVPGFMLQSREHLGFTSDLQSQFQRTI